MCFSRALDLAVSTTAAARVRPGQPRQRLAERRLDRLRPADRRQLALDRLPFGVGEVADLHQGVDEEAQAEFGRQPRPPRYAGA